MNDGAVDNTPMMLEPTPFRDGTTLEPSAHLQGIYIVYSSVRPSSRLNTSQQMPQQHHLGEMTTVDRIVRNTSLDISHHERESTHVSSSLLDPTHTLDPTAALAGGVVNETPLIADRSKLKRTRQDHQFAIDDPNDDARNDPKKVRYRSYQQDQWDIQFQELLRFRERHGHCHVPHAYDNNPTLARWAKRQRYQYKMKLKQKQSSLSNDRQQKLDEVGFTWDLQTMAWQERFNELVEYVRRNGNCNVPNRFGENPTLGMWVKSQRRQYKLYRLDPSSSRLTPERYQLLTNLGFAKDQPLAGGSPNKKIKGVNSS
ncbi:unnamed protein product [Cylindrotheca closterium]|uniref:Helicase-associated domain-containing protein n=1 Tax=Cylindrotheca closterium TaxID=2856 RepID=A0AAD2G163_9STRA|nr:unnamed protein product [Cylindrotheca closterium]